MTAEEYGDSRICVVTGGAVGIGRAIVDALAAEGAVVVIADRDAALGVQAARELTASGRTAEFVAVNVANEHEVEECAAWIDAQLGHVDVLVNNAGLGMREGSILEMSRKQWDLAIAVNLTGPFLMARYLVPLMPRGGCVLNIAGTAALRAVGGTDAYCAAKGGVISLSKAMAVSLAPRGIRVNAVCPGIVSSEEMASRYDEPVVQRMIERVGPLREQFGTPTEVGAVVAFLAGPAASYVNGATITVDGGGLS